MSAEGILAVLTSLALLGTAVPVPSTADAPQPCCIPDQWEATMFQQDAAFNRPQDKACNHLTLWLPVELFVAMIPSEIIATKRATGSQKASYLNTINKLSFDYQGSRVALQTQVLNDQSNVTTTYKAILDYKQQIQWVIVKEFCNKQPLPLNMTPPCIPDNSQFLGSRTYGGVAANTWVFLRSNTTSRMTVSNDGCYLLAQSDVMTTEVWRLTIINYQNFTAGIKDPSVFTIPEICNKADQPQHVLRQHQERF